MPSYITGDLQRQREAQLLEAARAMPLGMTSKQAADVLSVKPAEPERWVPTETRGYQCNTTTGAVRKTPEYASAPSAPPWGPCGVLGVEDDGACCVPSESDLMKAVRRIGPTHLETTKAIPGLEGVGSVYDIPADKRAAVIEALNKLEA